MGVCPKACLFKEAGYFPAVYLLHYWLLQTSAMGCCTKYTYNHAVSNWHCDQMSVMSLDHQPACAAVGVDDGLLRKSTRVRP